LIGGHVTPRQKSKTLKGKVKKRGRYAANGGKIGKGGRFWWVPIGPGLEKKCKRRTMGVRVVKE